MKKPIPAGFLTLATAYGIHFISSLLRVQEWTPSGLLVEAQKLMPAVGSSLLISLAVTILLVAAMILITLALLKRMEWNTRTAQ